MHDYYDGKYEENKRIVEMIHRKVDYVIRMGSSNVNSLHILQDLRREVLGIASCEVK